MTTDQVSNDLPQNGHIHTNGFSCNLRNGGHSRPIDYKDGVLSIEDVSLQEIVERYGTPSYVYSTEQIRQNFEAFQEGLEGYPAEICYAVKANSNLAILNLLARLGAGFDIVSGGELARVIAARGDPRKVVFSGVGKTDEEIAQALKAEIACFNVESMDELGLIEKVGMRMNRIAPIACRVNPDVDAKTHPHITTGLKECKFGIGMEEAFECYRYATESKFLRIKSIACHIGSQITSMKPFLEALDQMIGMHQRLEKEGIEIKNIDLGGGLGICYRSENPPSIREYCHAIKNKLKPYGLSLTLAMGRSLVANSGVLLTCVTRLKKSQWKNFAITDAGMNDFLRPALYGGWHCIQEVIQNPPIEIPEITYDVVGSICESSDVLGKERSLRVQPGDLVAVRDVGAYGFCLSSNYNTKPKAVELLVDGGEVHVIKPRERVEDLFKNEVIPDEFLTTNGKNENGSGKGEEVNVFQDSGIHEPCGGR